MVAPGACAAAASSANDVSDLEERTWRLAESTVPALAGGDIDPARYTIEFGEGTFDAQVDCNRASGTYTSSNEGLLTITPGPSTVAACPEGSLGSDYLVALQSTTSQPVTDGRLVLTTPDGTLTFE